MWLFTTQGLYSAVVHRDNRNLILVRARAREDLEALQVQLPQIEIVETPEADYRWRADVDREKWRWFLSAEAGEIDYDNFKGAVGERHGYDRACVYSDVWSVMRRVQEQCPPPPAGPP